LRYLRSRRKSLGQAHGTILDFGLRNGLFAGGIRLTADKLRRYGRSEPAVRRYQQALFCPQGRIPRSLSNQTLTQEADILTSESRINSRWPVRRRHLKCYDCYKCYKCYKCYNCYKCYDCWKCYDCRYWGSLESSCSSSASSPGFLIHLKKRIS
jgi:hypothetical protein